MANTRNTRTRRQPPEEEADQPRHASRGRKQSVAPVIAMVGSVAALGIGFAAYSSQNKPAAGQGSATGPSTAQPAVDPFAGIADETGPRSMSPGGKRTGLVERSPADLLDDPVWTAAAETANGWIAKHNEAQQALKAKENDRYLALGLQVRDAFNLLLEDTAEWEAGLSTRYSEDDTRVRKIMRERDKWFSIVGKYKGL